MANYTLAELEELSRLRGEGDSTETYQNQLSTDTYQPPSRRRDVRVEICNTVHKAGEPISLLEICKRLKVKKAPWMHRHVNDLVREGHLIRTQTESKAGFLMYLFDVNRD